jgi:hypothetical protein
MIPGRNRPSGLDFGRTATGKAPKSTLRPAEGRPEGRFRCLPKSSPAKIRPGNPEALLRNIEYSRLFNYASGPRTGLPNQKLVPNCPGRRPGQFGTGFCEACGQNGPKSGPRKPGPRTTNTLWRVAVHRAVCGAYTWMSPGPGSTPQT